MFQKLFSASLYKRTAFFISVLTGALWVCWPHVCMAQRSAQKDMRSRVMERLEEEEAARLLAFFRAQRPAENFCFQFQSLSYLFNCYHLFTRHKQWPLFKGLHWAISTLIQYISPFLYVDIYKTKSLSWI